MAGRRVLLALVVAGCGGAAGGMAPDAGGPDATSPDAAPAALSCPRGGVALDSGSYVLSEDCVIAGDVVLSGGAALYAADIRLTIDGNITLEGDAVLSLHGGALTLANHFPAEHAIQSAGRARLELTDLVFSTNAAPTTGNLFANYTGRGDSVLAATRVELDPTRSWLLASLGERARLETVDSAHVPTEIYPADAATVRLAGPASQSGVWLLFPPGSEATLDDLPQAAPFTYSFGRHSAGVVGIGYQVDVVQGGAGFSILSLPRSQLSIRNASRGLTIGYFLVDVTAPETLAQLPTGTVTTTLLHQGRRLALENVVLNVVPWQIYVDNPRVADPAWVDVVGSTVNEIGAWTRGRVRVTDSTLQWAVLAAAGAGSRIEVRGSAINSQTIEAAQDAAILIEDSTIYGSLIEAAGAARIVLRNTRRLGNLCHAACSPFCTPGGVCNPFNPSTETTLLPRERGAILALRLDPVAAPIRVGASYTFTGDLEVASRDTALAGATYNLSYRPAAASAWTPIVTGGAGPIRGAALGTLDTSGLAAGSFVVRLQLVVPDGPPLEIGTAFAVAP